MKFKKGISGNVSRGKEHSWAKISFWMDKIAAEWDKLTPNQKTHYSVELAKLLINKAKALPISPEESLLNADEAMAQLNQIASKTNIKAEIKPDQTAP